MADPLFRNSAADRRREFRIPARVEIHFEHAHDAARAFKAYSLNFSPGGLCVRMRDEHSIGDRMAVKILVEGEDFDLEAVVAWVHGKVTGMRFDGLSASDRLRLEKVAALLRTRPGGSEASDAEL